MLIAAFPEVQDVDVLSGPKLSLVQVKRGVIVVWHG